MDGGGIKTRQPCLVLSAALKIMFGRENFLVRNK